MQRFNIFLFLLLSVGVFTLIVYKAVFVPITHDEVYTALYTAQKNSFWEIMMYPDAIPNNHILNTLLTKISIAGFGMKQWVIRLPSILSFLIYIYAVYRFVKSTVSIKSWLFFPAALVFVSIPYYLDFFSVCRGYGMASAFGMLSLSYLITGFSLKRFKQVMLALIFAMLAVYANFTLLVFYAAICILSLLYLVLNWSSSGRKWLTWFFLLNAVFAALIAVPIYKMQSTDQFVYWTNNGFFKDTVLSLVDMSTADSRVYSNSGILAWCVAIFVAIACFIGLVIVKRRKNKLTVFQEPFIVVLIVLLLTIMVNLIQVAFLGTPNLSGRTALFFIPLFMALLVAGFSLALRILPAWVNSIVGGIILLLSVQHVSTTTNLAQVREWWFDRHNLEVLAYLEEVRGGKDVLVETNWLFNPAMEFYQKNGTAPWLKLIPYQEQLDENTSAAYCYVMEEDYAKLAPRYDIVLQFDKMALMKRRVE